MVTPTLEDRLTQIEVGELPNGVFLTGEELAEALLYPMNYLSLDPNRFDIGSLDIDRLDTLRLLYVYIQSQDPIIFKHYGINSMREISRNLWELLVNVEGSIHEKMLSHGDFKSTHISMDDYVDDPGTWAMLHYTQILGRKYPQLAWMFAPKPSLPNRTALEKGTYTSNLTHLAHVNPIHEFDIVTSSGSELKGPVIVYQVQYPLNPQNLLNLSVKNGQPGPALLGVKPSPIVRSLPIDEWEVDYLLNLLTHFIGYKPKINLGQYDSKRVIEWDTSYSLPGKTKSLRFEDVRYLLKYMPWLYLTDSVQISPSAARSLLELNLENLQRSLLYTQGIIDDGHLIFDNLAERHIEHYFSLTSSKIAAWDTENIVFGNKLPLPSAVVIDNQNGDKDLYVYIPKLNLPDRLMDDILTLLKDEAYDFLSNEFDINFVYTDDLSKDISSLVQSELPTVIAGYNVGGDFVTTSDSEGNLLAAGFDNSSTQVRGNGAFHRTFAYAGGSFADLYRYLQKLSLPKFLKKLSLSNVTKFENILPQLMRDVGYKDFLDISRQLIPLVDASYGPQTDITGDQLDALINISNKVIGDTIATLELYKTTAWEIKLLAGLTEKTDGEITCLPWNQLALSTWRSKDQFSTLRPADKRITKGQFNGKINVYEDAGLHSHPSPEFEFLNAILLHLPNDKQEIVRTLLDAENPASLHRIRSAVYNTVLAPVSEVLNNLGRTLDSEVTTYWPDLSFTDTLNYRGVPIKNIMVKTGINNQGRVVDTYRQLSLREYNDRFKHKFGIDLETLLQEMLAMNPNFSQDPMDLLYKDDNIGLAYGNVPSSWSQFLKGTAIVFSNDVFAFKSKNNNPLFEDYYFINFNPYQGQIAPIMRTMLFDLVDHIINGNFEIEESNQLTDIYSHSPGQYSERDITRFFYAYLDTMPTTKMTDDDQLADFIVSPRSNNQPIYGKNGKNILYLMKRDATFITNETLEFNFGENLKPMAVFSDGSNRYLLFDPKKDGWSAKEIFSISYEEFTSLPNDERNLYELCAPAYIQPLEKSPMRILGPVLEQTDPYQHCHFKSKTKNSGSNIFQDMINRWWIDRYGAPPLYF